MELLTIAALVLAVLFASLVLALGQPTTSVVDIDRSHQELPQSKSVLTGSGLHSGAGISPGEPAPVPDAGMT